MAIAVGQAAPDFTLKDQSMKEVKLADFKGKKNVVLVFYPLDWSPTCTNEHACFVNEMKQFETLDAQVLGIGLERGHAAGISAEFILENSKEAFAAQRDFRARRKLEDSGRAAQEQRVGHKRRRPRGIVFQMNALRGNARQPRPPVAAARAERQRRIRFLKAELRHDSSRRPAPRIVTD